jgi:trehalose-phosphatase
MGSNDDLGIDGVEDRIGKPVEHLLEAWPGIVDRFDHGHVLLMTDFDGTLTPIVSRPSEVVLSKEMGSILAELNAKEWCTVAVISGRALDDLTERLKIDDIVRAGNHGSEIEGPGLSFRAPVAEKTMAAIRRVLYGILALPLEYRGVEIEDKKLSLSVHFRNAAEGAVDEITGRVLGAASPYVESGLLRAHAGKKVLEIRSPWWNKGKALRYLVAAYLTRLGGTLFPIFMGDDATDEDAFRAIGNEGLTVFVGRDERSNASYRLDYVDEVQEFLNRLLRIERR